MKALIIALLFVGVWYAQHAGCRALLLISPNDYPRLMLQAGLLQYLQPVFFFFSSWFAARAAQRVLIAGNSKIYAFAIGVSSTLVAVEFERSSFSEPFGLVVPIIGIIVSVLSYIAASKFYSSRK